MFYEAENFNQDLSNWNVSSVTDMSNMFNGAISFNQTLSKWGPDLAPLKCVLFANGTPCEPDCGLQAHEDCNGVS